ncbi:hypothetical protein ATC00_12755 [Sinorhizobium americanum]|nr:hypothetical protein ATC00_12755 [Sinorhizobium americanum]
MSIWRIAFDVINRCEIARSSIAPEKPMRAMLLQAFYSIRSERLLMKRLQNELLLRWLTDHFSADGTLIKACALMKSFDANARRANSHRKAAVGMRKQISPQKAFQPSTSDQDARLTGRARTTRPSWSHGPLAEGKPPQLAGRCVPDGA